MLTKHQKKVRIKVLAACISANAFESKHINKPETLSDSLSLAVETSYLFLELCATASIPTFKSGAIVWNSDKEEIIITKK